MAFASLLVALVAAAPAPAVVDSHTAGIQVALRAKGLYHGQIDGIRGPMTNRAVRTFQRRARLQVDGVAGPRTRARLGRLGRPLYGRRLIRHGQVGLDVSVLQFTLSRRGMRVGGIDGVFGRNTDRAVRRFQSRRGLVVDGVVGPVTRRALKSNARGVFRPERAHGASRAEVNVMLGRWARRYGVSKSLVRAVAWMESGFRWNVFSSAGAWGVMQVMPATWDFVEAVLMGRNVRHTARGNIRVGIVYLRHMLRLFGGRKRLAVAAYYQGPQAVRRRGLYRETRVYVRTVLALQRRF